MAGASPMRSPLVPLANLTGLGAVARQMRVPVGLQALDQAGIDQQSIEAARLGAVIAAIKDAAAAPHDLLLLREGGIERNPGGLDCDQRQIRSIDRLERERGVDRREIDRVDSVVGRVVAL